MSNLSLASVKRHLRIEHDEEDDILTNAYIPAAIECVQDYIGLPDAYLGTADGLGGIELAGGGKLKLANPGLTPACEQAVLLIIGAIYANRGALEGIPMAARHLLDPKRNLIFAGA